MKSILYVSEKVENKDRKFGSAPYYYPATIVFKNGAQAEAMFTMDQIHVAVSRARQNPEDVPPKSFWEKVFK